MNSHSELHLLHDAITVSIHDAEEHVVVVLVEVVVVVAVVDVVEGVGQIVQSRGVEVHVAGVLVPGHPSVAVGIIALKKNEGRVLIALP